MGYVKKILIWAIVIGALYFVLSHHFILVGGSVKLLKKSTLTLNYTIFSTKGKTNESILSNDELRKDGIGEILVEEGLMTEEEWERLTAKFEEEES
jgi:hypothetical protein